MIGRSAGHRVSITGLGGWVPERVLTNDELSTMVDTSDEWIVERTGIRERRLASAEEALSDICLPAARIALEQAGADAADLDMVIVATVTPDMAFPATAALIANELGAENAGGYDLSAGCTGFVYAVAQAHAMIASGMSERILVVGGDVLSKVLDWTDRGTCVLFGDGAGAVVLERVDEGGFMGFELGADGGGGMELYLPAGGSRMPITPEVLESRKHLAHMNGREVFKFATRILVYSAEAVLAEVGLSVDDVDVYVPHQANIRIINHAAHKLGIPDEKVVVNVDRYGNTSSGSIPLALVDAVRDGRIHPGAIVLLTGMGAGLTWGSSVMEWTEEMAA
jgi:3-oxoacyl-[acyl-carrier-protein] synthase-3